MAWRDSLTPWPENNHPVVSPAVAMAGPTTAQHVSARPAPLALAVPGVPSEWCAGVARLGSVPPPAMVLHVVHRGRWDLYQADCARVLQHHATGLHATGWDALDLFGLHREAPVTNPAGWGLAWLLAGGEVLDTACDQVGLRRGPKGARMAVRRLGGLARCEVTPVWELLGHGDAP